MHTAASHANVSSFQSRVSSHRLASPRCLAPTRRSTVAVKAAFSPPTVTETKAKFITAYSKPVAPMYNTVLQELLVQQHFIRHRINYSYNPIHALGVVSAFDQILDSLPEAERNAIFTAYIGALGEEAETYRKDAAELEKLASEVSGPSAMTADASGSFLQQALASVASASEAGKFAYNKFFAIGLFRLLELSGAREPAALEKLVSVVGVSMESVNKDLNLYKGILSKLSAAKELMQEFLEREKRKQAERDAAKTAKESNSPIATA